MLSPCAICCHAMWLESCFSTLYFTTLLYYTSLSPPACEPLLFVLPCWTCLGTAPMGEARGEGVNCTLYIQRGSRGRRLGVAAVGCR